MAFDRTTILQEPGLLVFGEANIYSKAEIVVDFIAETAEIETDAFGPVDERDIDRRVEIRLTPVGEVEALAVLFPHGGLILGESPFGATDATAVIYTPSGKSLTVHNAAVTQMPSLSLGHTETAFGEVVITGLMKKSGAPQDANAYFTYVASAATYPGDAGFDPSAIKTLGFQGTWGSSPWADFLTESGFAVSFSTSFEGVPVDGHGTVDMRLSGLTVEVTATPVGVPLADVLTALKFQGSGNALGATKVGASDLIIDNQVGATQLHFELLKPILKQSPARFGASVRGVGELVWRATRTITAGSPDPIFYIGVSAPA